QWKRPRLLPEHRGIPDDWPGYRLDLLACLLHCSRDLDCVWTRHGVSMTGKYGRLVRDIVVDLDDHDVVMLCVLKGGHQFCPDLVEAIPTLTCSSTRFLLVRVVFVQLKSFLAIVDTGKTRKALLAHVWAFGSEMIRVAGLLVKRRSYDSGCLLDYVGFEIPNRFVVGYAFDYNEYFRDLGGSVLPPGSSVNNDVKPFYRVSMLFIATN
uniref:Phosphoribosyl transferase domain containing 1b n=1 Tax=Electrophorus electricus TaxID=8005 RepID=A0A4W4F7H5_ELEEL